MVPIILFLKSLLGLFCFFLSGWCLCAWRIADTHKSFAWMTWLLFPFSETGQLCETPWMLWAPCILAPAFHKMRNLHIFHGLSVRYAYIFFCMVPTCFSLTLFIISLFIKTFKLMSSCSTAHDNVGIAVLPKIYARRYFSKFLLKRIIARGVFADSSFTKLN